MLEGGCCVILNRVLFAPRSQKIQMHLYIRSFSPLKWKTMVYGIDASLFWQLNVHASSLPPACSVTSGTET